jgi:hypothetical protein
MTSRPKITTARGSSQTKSFVKIVRTDKQLVSFPSVIVHVLCPVGDLKNLQRLLLQLQKDKSSASGGT